MVPVGQEQPVKVTLINWSATYEATTLQASA